MLVIGLASIAAAYLYTGGPYPLAYHGLGEVFVLLFFGVVAVGGTFYAHSLQLTQSAVIAGFAAGSLATVLLIINNLRDVDGDRQSRKLTTVVRFGATFARAEIAFFATVPFLAAAAVAWIHDRWWLLLTLVALPLAMIVIRCAHGSRGRELNRCLGLAGALQWLFGVLFVIGCAI
jgi:1,4-dihydroxy-2-naphthoate octaprenyltransferase